MSGTAADPLLATGLPDLPYPGLRPFEAREWRIFFGRETMINEVIERMAGQHLVFIHGASGSGKSSLVRAGVLPKLAQLHRRHGSPWTSCAMRPSGGPLWNLAAAFAELEGRAEDFGRIGEILGLFSRRGATLSAVARDIAGLADKQLCILVDQFEEVFRFEQETSREEAEQFIDLLIREIPEAAESPDPQDDQATLAPAAAAGNVQVIVTMRSEFLGDCARFDRFAEAINRAQYLVPRLTRAALTRAIRMPARLFGGEVTPALSDRLIAEVRGKSDELPLIQHGLMLIWDAAARRRERAQSIVLDDALLEQAGSLRELLSMHAEQVLRDAATDNARLAGIERLFRAITDLNAEGQAIRRPQAFHELVDVCDLPEPALREVIDAFRAEGASFLTPYGSARFETGAVIDISHEALIRCWRTLADWMKDEAKMARQYKDLVENARRWDARGRAAQHLLNGEELREAGQWWDEARPSAAWAKRYGGNFEQAEALLQASALALRAEEVRREAEVQRRQRRRRMRRINAYAAAALMVVVAGSIWQFGGTAANALGRHYANAQDIVQALRWYQIAATLRDAPAELAIANIYANGTGVAQDDGQAYKWYLRAAADGSADAADQLGWLYENGKGVGQDYVQSMIWYRKGAAGGNLDASYEIGVLYSDGSGVTQDYGQALHWYQAAADRGDQPAEFALGWLYQYGYGVHQNYALAMQWYLKALAQGELPDADNNIGVLYADGDGVAQSYAQAMHWYQKAAAQGDAVAQRNIGDFYDAGDGVKQDYSAAMSWYQKAAAQGDAAAQRDIGFIYYDGDGVAQDYGQAMTWFQKAAAQGDAMAERAIGALYGNGYGVTQDYGQAMAWYQKAAVQGDPVAEFDIGYLYDFGDGVKQDYAQGLTWYRQAAQQGEADAENNIGVDYEDGEGVAQDYGQAMQWFQKAAAQGNALSEKNIGDLYNQGEGVKQDYAQALIWYQKAAKDGSADAQDKIGLAYLAGNGVAQDFVQAMHWFKTASHNGSTDAAQQIGLMYLNGQGVSPDDQQALSWFETSTGDSAADADDAIGEAFLNGNGVKQDAARAMAWFQKAAELGSSNAADEVGFLYLGGDGVAQNHDAAMQAFKQGLQFAQAALAGNPASVQDMGTVAWQYILVGDAKAAVNVAATAYAQAPDQIWLQTNEADALMMLGETASARKIYLQHEDVQDDGDGNAWKTDVLADFDTLTKLGDHYPLMQEIRNDFAHEMSGARQGPGQ